MKKDLLEQKMDLTPHELTILESELKKHIKSPAELWLLWLFTSTWGGHRYYLGDKGRAIAHTIVFLIALISWLSFIFTEAEAPEDELFSFIFFFSIPELWALIDAFFIGRRLEKKNAEIEMSLINKIKSLRS